MVATSFALLFLAKGRAPVLINKLRHGPRGDWNNDPDDVRNLVASSPRLEEPADLADRRPGRRRRRRTCSRPRSSSSTATGVPEFTAGRRQNIRDFVEQGGFLFADACCGSPRVRPRLPPT